MIAPARVLVVDDEPAVRAIAREALSRAGYGVLLAADGLEAVKMVQVEGATIGVVLLDLTMPGLSGTETLRAIRAAAPALPVVLTSGYTAEEVTGLCHGDPFAGFLQKPFTPASLVSTLRPMLAQGGGA